MRFGVLGTGFWAREIHAASLAAHPTAELVGVWGRDLAKAKAVGAAFDVPGFGDVDALLPRSTPSRSRCRRTCRRRWPSGPPRPGKHLLLEKPIALDVAAPTGSSTRCATPGWRRSCSSPSGSSAATSTWLTQAARTTLAGGRRLVARLAGRLAVRLLAVAQGARGAVGHRAARAVAARPGAGAGRRGAGRCRAAGHRAPGAHPRGGRRLDGDAVATVAPLSGGIEFFVHGDAGRLVLLPSTAIRAPTRSPSPSTS